MPFRTEERIAEALRVNVVVGASCDGCDAELEMIDGHSAKGALLLTLGGGYAMFFDDVSVVAVLCSQCSVKLLETFPGLNKAMKAQAIW